MLGPGSPHPKGIHVFAVSCPEALHRVAHIQTVGERRNYCGLNWVSTNVYVVRTRVTLIIHNMAQEGEPKALEFRA